MKSILLLSAALVLIPTHAHAQKREYTPGLNYTAMPTNIVPSQTMTETEPAAGQEAVAPPTAPSAPQVQNAAFPQAPVAPHMAPAQAPVEEDTKVRIWNKYKALAGGEAEAAPVQAAVPEATGKTTMRKMDEPEAAQTSPGGMAAILQSWEQTKSRQSEMRSKSFAVPASLEHLKTTSQPQAEEAADGADPR